jgi:NADPH:quinone reductase-like Zn-dependent oxidoreductase
VAQGTGGVSLFVVQLAKAHGATVVLTSSSDAKLAVAASLGVDHSLNYRTTPDWHEQVRALTGRRGADLVVDVGGPATLARSVRATRMGGTVAIVGALGGFTAADLPVAVAMTQNIHLVGITVGSVAAHADLSRAVEATCIRPHVSHTCSWDRLADAMRTLEANEHVGKIAITVP